MGYKYSLNIDGFSIEKINIFSVSREKNYKHSFMDGRPCHAFIYTESGSILDEFAHPRVEKIVAGSGTLVFIPKGTRYSATYLDDETKLKTVQFEINTGALPPYLCTPQKIELTNARAVINSFFNAIENAKANHTFHYISLLYDLFWQIDTQYNGLPKKFMRLAAALEDISVSPEKNEKISYYANMCFMSEVNFRRLFREYTGKSPIEYRNELRLKKAKSMLQSGEYNVSESAEATGFTNLSFFIRLYKEFFGHTPKKE